MYDWVLSQQNRICFVMVDSSNIEVAGLGAGFTLQLSKNGGAFAASGGTKAEIGNGWYTYVSLAAEADTIGPVAIRVTGAGSIQQNLEYVVKQRTPNAIPFTYTVTNSVTSVPIEGVAVWITTDIAGVNVIWSGTTDTNGIAKSDGDLPYLDPGTYYFWSQHQDYAFSNPDTEVVS